MYNKTPREAVREANKLLEMALVRHQVYDQQKAVGAFRLQKKQLSLSTVYCCCFDMHAV
jgi:hypothetical protein